MKSEKDMFISRGCRCSPKSFPSTDKFYDKSCCKLDTYNWLDEIVLPPNQEVQDYTEIRFKNSRKEFFRNTEKLKIKIGDIVAVEATPGHDVGIVSMMGEMVILQMRKKRIDPVKSELKKIYRKAKPADIEKWIQALELEETTMFKARKLVDELKLSMKINDIEYQGDKTKAIFYYTADDRVDFRELIKLLAEKFMVRIEMRQIGARQEASHLGGLALAAGNYAALPGFQALKLFLLILPELSSSLSILKNLLVFVVSLNAV